MKTVPLPIAYMPLVDAAPLIVAQEMGFAAAEGLSLELIAAPSWSSVRDMLAFGRVDAAHLLSPAAAEAKEWLDADYSVMNFAPAPLTRRPGDGPPHIRLDKAAQFLFGDKL